MFEDLTQMNIKINKYKFKCYSTIHSIAFNQSKEYLNLSGNIHALIVLNVIWCIFGSG